MIADPSTVAVAEARSDQRHAPWPGRIRPRVLVLAVAACEVAGMAAIVKSYLAAQTTVSDEAEFIWFWAGLTVAELPVIAVLARRATSAAARSALLILVGFLSYAPKLLRDPGTPAYHDEYAHWRAVYDIIATGRLFQPAQIIPVISGYPGLHAATAVIVDITGLSIWQAATVLLLACHIALLLGIAALARGAGLDSRAAALAAVAYGFNASFLYFDTQFAYESMGITLVAWALAAFAQAIRSRPGPPRRAWCCVTAVLSLGCVVTHHLSTIELTAVMAVVSVALSLPRVARSEGWKRTAATAWCLTAFTAVAISAWIAFVAPDTIGYLSPYLGAGLSQLVGLAAGSSSGRQLFSGSLSPWWEHMAAYGVTIVALGAAAGGLLLIRRRLSLQGELLPDVVRDRPRWQRAPFHRARSRTTKALAVTRVPQEASGVTRLPRGSTRALLLACAAVGLVYFPSTLFVLSPAGAEGARRTWAISWIGLAIVAAPVAVSLVDWAGRRVRAPGRVTARGVLAALTVTCLVGGTAAGLDASYRFPGPYLFGSDARSDTAELNAMTQWFLATFGAGNNVVTDRYTGLLMASYGLQDLAEPSTGFPVWDLYTDEPGQSLGPPFLIADLTSGGFRYLVVDKRMATDVPEVGIYFEGTEPGGFVLPDGRPVFAGRLAKFNGVLWMTEVFESDNYAVYRMDLPIASVPYQAKPVPLHAKLELAR